MMPLAKLIEENPVDVEVSHCRPELEKRCCILSGCIKELLGVLSGWSIDNNRIIEIRIDQFHHFHDRHHL